MERKKIEEGDQVEQRVWVRDKGRGVKRGEGRGGWGCEEEVVSLMKPRGNGWQLLEAHFLCTCNWCIRF